jgi:pimeloyl-ACP methyl ester carboxylesterase
MTHLTSARTIPEELPTRTRLPDDFRPSTPSRRLVVRSADGTRLAVEVHGEPLDETPGERPTVVLAHGWTCSASFWVRVVHRLRTDLRVVVYDQRGHGRSQAVGVGGFTPDAIADDLAAVLTATAPDDGRTVVAGHSMGAMAVVALAGRRHDVLAARVGAVLLASTGVAELVGRMAVLPLRERSATSRARERLVRVGMADARALHRLPLPVARALVSEVTLAPGATRAEREFTADIVLACPPATYLGFGEMLAALDLRSDLTALDVPAEVLVGTRDRLTPPWHAHGMAAALPLPAGLVEVPGAGHMTPVTAPDAVSDAVRALVARTRPAARPQTPASSREAARLGEP